MTILLTLIAGIAIGATSMWLRLHSVAHANAVPVRHTGDHRCRPPHSHWSTVDDDACYVEFGALDRGKLSPGDVWTCPDCLGTRIIHDGQWRVLDGPAITPPRQP